MKFIDVLEDISEQLVIFGATTTARTNRHPANGLDTRDGCDWDVTRVGARADWNMNGIGIVIRDDVKVNTACIAKSEQYSVKQLSVQTESSPVRGKP